MNYNLGVNDEVRVLAPSRSLKLVNKEIINLAQKRLEKMGLQVTYGKNVMFMDDDYKTASIPQRVEDIMDAFNDKNVKAILTVLGGYNSNQLLKYIDYDIIKNNPKIFCGYSDITAILNAIYVKTNVMTFCGPHFSTFGMKYGIEYTLENFRRMFFDAKSEVCVFDSSSYSDDKWYVNQDERVFLKNEGIKVLNEGIAEGKIIGGNLNTFVSLAGTEYMPDLKDKILFLENVDLIPNSYFQEFDRNFQSLSLLSSFKHIKGIVIGRSQVSSNMNDYRWKKIFSNRGELKKIPIIYNADFGHTSPIFTFPIGGECKINTYDAVNKIIIKK